MANVPNIDCSIESSGWWLLVAATSLVIARLQTNIHILIGSSPVKSIILRTPVFTQYLRSAVAAAACKHQERGEEGCWAELQ